MKLYPYLYRFQDEHKQVLFHPLNMGVLYAAPDVEQEELLRYLDGSQVCGEWVVEDDFSYDAYVKKMISENDIAAIDIKTLKMFTTTRCNLNCTYCLIEKNLETRCVGKQDLSLEDGLRVLKKFSDLVMTQEKADRTIMLYGGEPLMNRENVFAFIRYIRDYEKRGLFNGAVELVMESNGTLVTEEDAKFLKENDVFIIVSLDGLRHIHDTYRVKKDGTGSYDEALQGYRRLKKYGCKAVISSVFTDCYAKEVEACIAEMTEHVKPDSIGLNLFHVLEDQEIQNDTTKDNYGRYIRAFELAREKGLYIEHIMRRIRPLTDRKVRIKDCGACGNRIVSDVNGNIGICEGFVGNQDYFKRRDDYCEVKTDETFRTWFKRTPLTMEGCRGCRAMGICGGGCVNNAILQNGDVFSPDNYICESSKAFIDWALETWFTDNGIGESLGQERIHILSERERGSLLGILGTRFDIPLQTMSKQYERSVQVTPLSDME